MNQKLKKMIKELSININNPLVSARISQSYVGAKDVYKQVKESINWFESNFEKLSNLLESSDKLDEFSQKAERLLSMTTQSNFDVHNFMNIALYLNEEKENMDKTEQSSAEEIFELKTAKSGIDKIADLAVKKLGIKYEELENTKKIVEENKKYITEIIHQANLEKDAYIDNVNKMKEDFENLEKQTHESIKNFEKSYNESMNLKESMHYWQKKSKRHMLFSWIDFLFFGMIICAPLYYIFHTQLVGKLMIFDASQILHLGVYILGISIWLWIARLVLKIALSNKHLEAEANEKETMIMTYLALTKEGAMDKNNEKIILEAIFRPSTNGLIKDDSAVTLLDIVRTMKK